ncbi:hypothetical protein SGLAD_v1c02420 [Spiroplasma gladiatoris]|uniref:Uncharacterized protein n=1 Tax=Spiroplasma gladiatoris TaxID=2143 RepID=A0A4P7AH51_9MOLU|nr:hypothetical protein [Spiroplasma gladiatoris]QBQ07441.1 hypothetical protein SGLAD_v1c02420 [Spiroplasma gladiatoris]
MKKILNLISVFGLSITTTSMTYELIKNNNQNLYNSKNDIRIFNNVIVQEKPGYYSDINNLNIDQRVVVSRYPSKVGKPDNFKSYIDTFDEIWASTRNYMYGIEDREIRYINVKNMMFDSRNDFLKKYSKVEVSYKYGYNYTDNGNKGWKKGRKGVNIGTPRKESKIIDLNNNDISIVVVDENYPHTSSSFHKIKINIMGQWVNSYSYRLSFSALASLDYNKGSSNAHAAYAGINFSAVDIH